MRFPSGAATRALVRHCCLALLLSLVLPAFAQAPRVLRLTTLEWPPYTGASLPEQGAATAVVRAALAAAGYRLRVEFYPWSRAVALAHRDAGVAGYFPEYASQEVARSCLLSDPIGSGPLGLVERADAPIAWNRLSDLARYRVGVVQGYVNTEEFDRRVGAGQQPVDAVADDTHNLLKVAARRVPLAVIDRRVFEYLARHDPQIAPLAPLLHFNERLLEDKQLFVCFRPGVEGERARRAFNEGLKRIGAADVMAAALK